MGHPISFGATQLSHCNEEAATMYKEKSVVLFQSLYLWTLKRELHVILMSQNIIVSVFILKHKFKNPNKIILAQNNIKQVTGQIWLIGHSSPTLVQSNGSQSAVPAARASSVNFSEMQVLRPV